MSGDHDTIPYHSQIDNSEDDDDDITTLQHSINAPSSSETQPFLASSSSRDTSPIRKPRHKKQQSSTWTKPAWCRPFVKKPMTAEERLTKNWIQKWRQHGRFPFKFVIHAALTAACTALVFMQTLDQTPYHVASYSTFYNVFFPAAFQYQGDYVASPFYVHTIDEVKSSVGHAIESYYTFPNKSINQYAIPGPPTMTVYSYMNCKEVYDTEQSVVDTRTSSASYPLSMSSWGPLGNRTSPPDASLLQDVFFCMEHMTLDFVYSTVHLEFQRPIRYVWYVQMYFDNNVQGGRMPVTLNLKKSPVSSLSYSKLAHVAKIMLDLAVIGLCIASQVLSWLSLAKSWKIFQKTRRIVQREARLTWDQLPFRTKMRFFNMWFVITIVGNLCAILGCVLDLVMDVDSEAGYIPKLLLGLGTLLIWVNMARYLEFDPKYTVLISSLTRGFPNTLRFLIGSIPIFVGFALFGVLAFSEYSMRFSTFGQACVTLFGLQNGDEIQQTFRSTNDTPYVGYIYTFAFVFISMYGVANIFIAIMDDSYSTSMRIFEEEAARRAEKKGAIKTDKPKDDSEQWEKLIQLHLATKKISAANKAVSKWKALARSRGQARERDRDVGSGMSSPGSNMPVIRLTAQPTVIQDYDHHAALIPDISSDLKPSSSSSRLASPPDPSLHDDAADDVYAIEVQEAEIMSPSMMEEAFSTSEPSAEDDDDDVLVEAMQLLRRQQETFFRQTEAQVRRLMRHHSSDNVHDMMHDIHVNIEPQHQEEEDNIPHDPDST
eukprot:TRINITY_DN1008_c1_g1_i5.p1 TRINITY_DN1008_c1_g1~~TRINITY_DN1008_c1_g1_i5.p1  ORF type:complete len:789 (-),score=238.23 TRINITY_DN1008_c1_g1_i5:67-2376(-)